MVHLIKQPEYFFPYLRTNIFSRTSALELELPWIAYAAIDFLDAYLRPQMSVFEYGSGGSTLFFARHCASVISIEDNAFWLEKVRQKLADENINNVRLQHRAFDFKAATDFEHSEYLNSIPDQKFDVILVDGSEESVQIRPTCFAHAENFVRAGGIIVVDDSWRYTQLRNTHHAKCCRIFKSVGPCRSGVTSTDVFFY